VTTVPHSHRISPTFVATLAIILDAERAWAGSLAYETAMWATDRRRAVVLVALGVAAVLALASHLTPRSRPVGATMRFSCGALFLVVSTYWLAFEGGCPFVWPRGGPWSARVDPRLVVAAAAATAFALGNLWIISKRRSRSRT
jgi:preprotein translocase subunit Sec61beta